MRTIRITLVGGPFCGIDINDHPREDNSFYNGGVRYIRTERRDAENRQVFQAVHSRTIKGLRSCDLG